MRQKRKRLNRAAIVLLFYFDDFCMVFPLLFHKLSCFLIGILI
nr:MAG TPA: hypothetical protein [Caudoviricetes sp.]